LVTPELVPGRGVSVPTEFVRGHQSRPRSLSSSNNTGAVDLGFSRSTSGDGDEGLLIGQCGGLSLYVENELEDEDVGEDDVEDHYDEDDGIGDAVDHVYQVGGIGLERKTVRWAKQPLLDWDRIVSRRDGPPQLKMCRRDLLTSFDMIDWDLESRSCVGRHSGTT
jgi:hypothetical protein